MANGKGSLDSGFTPLPDKLVQEFGVLTTAVWGRVYRYNQMDKGHCEASVRTIAKHLKLGTTATREALKQLTSSGYLTRHPVEGKPTVYKPTDKLKCEPQRQTLETSTPFVEPPQRHSLTKREGKERVKRRSTTQPEGKAVRRPNGKTPSAKPSDPMFTWGEKLLQENGYASVLGAFRQKRKGVQRQTLRSWCKEAKADIEFDGDAAYAAEFLANRVRSAGVK